VVRSVALYNLVIENWARAYYDSIKTLLVPGTHTIADAGDELPAAAGQASSTVGSGPAGHQDPDYERALDRLVADLRARHVPIVFLALAAFDGQAMEFATTGPYQRQFLAFAQSRGIPVLQSDEILRAAAGSRDLLPYFLDHGHMNAAGNRVVGAALADAAAVVLGSPERELGE
jgi:hypothetical protein